MIIEQYGRVPDNFKAPLDCAAGQNLGHLLHRKAQIAAHRKYRQHVVHAVPARRRAFHQRFYPFMYTGKLDTEAIAFFPNGITVALIIGLRVHAVGDHTPLCALYKIIAKRVVGIDHRIFAVRKSSALQAL